MFFPELESITASKLRYITDIEDKYPYIRDEMINAKYIFDPRDLTHMIRYRKHDPCGSKLHIQEVRQQIRTNVNTYLYTFSGMFNILYESRVDDLLQQQITSHGYTLQQLNHMCLDIYMYPDRVDESRFYSNLYHHKNIRQSILKMQLMCKQYIECDEDHREVYPKTHTQTCSDIRDIDWFVLNQKQDGDMLLLRRILANFFYDNYTDNINVYVPDIMRVLVELSEDKPNDESLPFHCDEHHAIRYHKDMVYNEYSSLKVSCVSIMSINNYSRNILYVTWLKDDKDDETYFNVFLPKVREDGRIVNVLKNIREW